MWEMLFGGGLGSVMRWVVGCVEGVARSAEGVCGCVCVCMCVCVCIGRVVVVRVGVGCLFVRVGVGGVELL